MSNIDRTILATDKVTLLRSDGKQEVLLAGAGAVSVAGGDVFTFKVGKLKRQVTFAPLKQNALSGTAVWVDGVIKTTLAPGINKLFLPGGPDLEVTVATAVPTPTPTPIPIPTPAPTPVPTDIMVGGTAAKRLRPGDSVDAELAKGPVALPRGETFTITQTINVRNNGLGIVAYGDSKDRPRILARGPFRPISVVSKRDFLVDGIEVTTTVDDSIEPSIWAQYAPGLQVRNSYLWHGRQGLAVQGGGGQFTVEDCLIRDCSRQNVGGGEQHGAGIYCDQVVPVVRRVMFDTCGWRPGYKSRDDKSHGIYIQGTCLNGTIVEDVFFYACSSHGLQARAGGTVCRCLALECAIGFSYGLVNGSEIHPGGVSGSISDFWTAGVVPISTNSRPGWAGHFGNILDATGNRLFASDDDCGTSEAFLVQPCVGIKNGPEIGIKKLVLSNLASTFKKGTYAGKEGRAASSWSLLSPARTPSLRAALGGSSVFAATARLDPSNAASMGIALCKAAWGV